MSAGALRAEQPRRRRPAAARPRPGRFDRPALIALAVLALAAAVLIVVEGRHMTFFFDEWDFLLGRRGHSAGDFLRAQNGNPSLFPVVAVQGAAAGLRDRRATGPSARRCSSCT